MALPDQGRPVAGDWIKPDGDDLIVIASERLPDWTATQFRRTAVIFEGTRYYVAEVFEPDRGRPRPEAGQGHRYRLSPWPDDLHDLPSNTVDYDESYVAARSARRQVSTRGLGVYLLALPLRPLLGLLPSGMKCSLEARYQIDALSTTRLSMRCEYILGLLCVGLIMPQILFGDPLGVGPYAAPVTGAILLLDSGMRWERMKEGGGRQYGALEWIFRRL